MALAQYMVQKARPRDKPYKLSDGGGLLLLVTPAGKRLWRFRYRFGGKQNMLSFGAFPEVSIGDARDKRDEARKLLAQGKDPSAERKAAKIAAQVSAQNTFGVGNKDHGGIAMAMPIGFGGLGQALHLIVGQILTRSQIGVFRPTRHGNCSFYDS